ncbi:MAG: response regulator [Sandaracinus sp.]|nr:response regulator [Sandaracinus sp.]|tara:strand:+ start:422 stop:808 length:387 start_codon:yes stop_codon:yes gene_type:complete
MTTPSLRVLLVDDDPDSRELLAMYLRGRGLEVSTAEDCSDAAAVFGSFTPDVAVVDLTLPDGDGCDLGASFRAQNQRLRLVALSGHAGSDYRSRTRDAGFDEYLVKPVDPNRIFSVISAGPLVAATAS